MAHEEIAVPTKDGTCPTHVLTPQTGEGPWPAVILYMDAGGIRPAVIGMAQRLAEAGYVVLLPDLYYRAGAYGPFDPVELFKGDFRSVIGPLRATMADPFAVDDTKALLAYLDTRRDVAGRKIGTVGFCMGGGIALTAAGLFPDRVAAAISFHGGNLATDDAGSPHRLAPRIKGEVYVAGADNDGSYPPDMAERLEQALTDAGVTHKCEIYAGAAHGWMKPDFPVYDEAAAERGWTEMLALYDRTLR